MDMWSKPGGCRDRVLACQDALKDRDGLAGVGGVTKNVTKICGDADECLMPGTREVIGRAGFYDIAHPPADPFPPPHMCRYPILSQLHLFLRCLSMNPDGALTEGSNWRHPGHNFRMLGLENMHRLTHSPMWRRTMSR